MVRAVDLKLRASLWCCAAGLTFWDAAVADPPLSVAGKAQAKAGRSTGTGAAAASSAAAGDDDISREDSGTGRKGGKKKQKGQVLFSFG